MESGDGAGAGVEANRGGAAEGVPRVGEGEVAGTKGGLRGEEGRGVAGS